MSFSPRFFSCALLISLCALLFGPSLSARAQNADSLPDFTAPSGVRVGAARVLRLVDAEGRPLQGSFSDPAWETRGGGLFFTRDFGGTRNIWRAFPDPRDPSRYPSWRALPVTQFTAPLFASHPVPLSGDRALLMVSNAAQPRGAAQITLFDLQKKALRALTDEPNGAFEPAPAPDGSAFAYTASRGKITSVWVQSLQNGAPAIAEAVAKNARRAAWQNPATLLVESSGDASIYRLSRPWSANVHPVRLTIGTQISASRDGSTLVLGAKTEGAPQLYLLSGDGSGLRVLNSTQGAVAPALSGDGRLLAFVAPLGESGLEAETRALWVLPLEAGSAEAELPQIPVVQPEVETPGVEVKTRVDAPVAQIRGVRAARRGAVAILGVAAGQNASATLEIGQGADPRRWDVRRVALPLAPGAPLLLWNPPARARGIWSFRLLVSNSGGAAQSLFRVQLPLASRTATPSNPVPSMPGGGPLPGGPMPYLPAPPPLPRPAPLSPLPPRPNPASTPPRGSLPDFPSNPVVPPQIPAPSAGDRAPSIPGTGATSGRDAATFNISNTLAEMRAGQTVNVTFWALNRGTRTWDVGRANRATGAVRLVTRWVNFENGNRRKWTLHWMKTPVLPGDRTRWSFNLTVPPQPGRYKLIYGLVRVPGENWTPPAFNAPQETWPNEFAAIAFAVTVKP